MQTGGLLQGIGMPAGVNQPGYSTLTPTGITGGAVSKGPGQNIPNYQQFLNSPQYAATQPSASNPLGTVGPSVVTPVTINGQTYNFGNPVQAQAYQQFMASQGQSSFQPQYTYSANRTPQPMQQKNVVQAQPQTTTTTSTNPPNNIKDYSVQQALDPSVPAGGVTQAVLTPTDSSQEVAQGTGTLTGSVQVPTSIACLLYTSPSPRDGLLSRMPSSA